MTDLARRSVAETTTNQGISVNRAASVVASDVSQYAWLVWLALAGIIAIGVTIRLLGLNQIGFNTDEAVYAGQAAGILNNAELKPYFPVFRAHPLLFQFILALTYAVTGVNDYVGRIVAVVIGTITIAVVFVLGKSLYNEKVGLLAALFMALMPYHVIITRQVLLDGPMTLFSTMALCAMACFGKTQSPRWLYATGLCIGLTFLAKETGIILLGSIYLFIALSPKLRVRMRDIVLSLALAGLLIAIFPLTISLAGAARTGQSYLIWQLLRRPNHPWSFYLTQVPPMMGLLLILAAALGLVLLRKQGSWRETLLVAWIVVPFAFFQLWPVKGFQYLLPIAPAVAVLGARAIVNIRSSHTWVWLKGVAIGAIVVTLALPTWQLVQAKSTSGVLAGMGGLPGGREIGLWVGQSVPRGAQIMAIGPSTANLIQFYGHRKTYMLSVSTNPLNRNPSYEPIDNPDLQLRNGEIQYLVWDIYSAERAPHFADRMLKYAERYHGRIVHTEQIDGQDIIRVYEVHP